MRRGQPWIGVFCRKVFVMGTDKCFFFFIIRKYSFRIKWNRVISKYKTIHIFYQWMCIWILGGVPVTGMLAGTNLSKAGMNLPKPWINLSKPGLNKHKNHVMIYNIVWIVRHSYSITGWSIWKRLIVVFSLPLSRRIGWFPLFCKGIMVW